MTAGLLDGDLFSVLTRVIKFSFRLKGIVQMFDIRCALTSKIHAWAFAHSTDHLTECLIQISNILNQKLLSKMSPYHLENNVLMYANVQPPLYHGNIFLVEQI